MIWKILTFAIAGYVLYRLFMNDKMKKNKDSDKEREELIASGELVQDPECKTYVDPETSVTIRNGDKKYYFCSYECRDAYLKKLEQ